MADEETAPAAPPNLRASDDESNECDSCVYFDHTHCTKFPPLCVAGEWVCDAWRASSTEKPAAPAARTVREAQRVALAHARAQKAKRQAPAPAGNSA